MNPVLAGFGLIVVWWVLGFLSGRVSMEKERSTGEKWARIIGIHLLGIVLVATITVLAL